MIKFFRKIRYDFMEKNETGKYLKYAIGEIILVVIGILIALSINNWNDERKETNSKKNIIVSLISDLEKDIESFKKNAIRNTKAIDYCNSFLKTGQIDSSLVFVNTIDSKYIFYPNNSKYKSIVSTNKIEILDDSTIDKLTSYYEYDYSRLKSWVLDNEHGSKKIEEFVVEKLPKLPQSEIDKKFNEGVSKILTTDEVYNLLSRRLDYRNSLNELMKITQKNAEKLVIELKKITKG